MTVNRYVSSGLWLVAGAHFIHPIARCSWEAPSLPMSALPFLSPQSTMKHDGRKQSREREFNYSYVYLWIYITSSTIESELNYSKLQSIDIVEGIMISMTVLQTQWGHQSQYYELVEKHNRSFKLGSAITLGIFERVTNAIFWWLVCTVLMCMEVYVGDKFSVLNSWYVVMYLSQHLLLPLFVSNLLERSLRYTGGLIMIDIKYEFISQTKNNHWK